MGGRTPTIEQRRTHLTNGADYQLSPDPSRPQEATPQPRPSSFPSPMPTSNPPLPQCPPLTRPFPDAHPSPQPAPDSSRPPQEATPNNIQALMPGLRAAGFGAPQMQVRPHPCSHLCTYLWSHPHSQTPHSRSIRASPPPTASRRTLSVHTLSTPGSHHAHTVFTPPRLRTPKYPAYTPS